MDLETTKWRLLGITRIKTDYQRGQWIKNPLGVGAQWTMGTADCVILFSSLQSTFEHYVQYSSQVQVFMYNMYISTRFEENIYKNYTYHSVHEEKVTKTHCGQDVHRQCICRVAHLQFLKVGGLVGPAVQPDFFCLPVLASSPPGHTYKGESSQQIQSTGTLYTFRLDLYTCPKVK